MIDSRRPNPDINGEDVERFPHKARAVVERRAPVQLRGGHPEVPPRVDPHGIHPQQTLVADKHRRRAVGGNLQDFLPVEAANVYVAFCVDRCPA